MSSLCVLKLFYFHVSQLIGKIEYFNKYKYLDVLKQFNNLNEYKLYQSLELYLRHKVV